MRPYKWVGKKAKDALKMYKKGISNAEIIKKLGVGMRPFKTFLTRMHKKGLPYYDKKNPNVGWEAYNNIEYLDEPILKEERKRICKKFNDGREKTILVLSDSHIPFQCPRVLEEASKVKADICVMVGDFLDFYSISRFRKTRLIPLRKEIEDGLAILKMLSEKFPYIIMAEANHEKRLIKVLQDRFKDNPEMVQLLMEQISILNKMSENFKNVEIINNWWFKIGKVIFAHPDWYTKIPTKTAQNSYEYFIGEGEDFDAIVNAHTHHLSKTPFRRKWLLENPCSCYKMDYMREGRRYHGEFHQGYGVIRLDQKGRFLCNESNLHFLGWG